MPTDAQPEPSATPLPKRRWFQYSISTLLLLIVVCAVVLALVVNPARRQRRAVEFVQSLGGGLGYSEKADVIWPIAYRQQSLSDKYFGTVEYVDLGTTTISDAGLAYLDGLTELEQFNLADTQVSDAGLAHLKGLTTLEWLWLDGTQVSAAGVAELQKALPNCSIVH